MEDINYKKGANNRIKIIALSIFFGGISVIGILSIKEVSFL